jgi:hypothetical protein
MDQIDPKEAFVANNGTPEMSCEEVAERRPSAAPARHKTDIDRL